MRSRGAQTTDIVVLVVDASEGVLEQTIESIRMIEAAKTPMVVALNKIDRPHADVEGTKRGLREAGVKLEDDGGDVQAVPISALKGTNIDELVEALLTLSEMLQLKADSEGNLIKSFCLVFFLQFLFLGKVEAVVIESSQEKGLGKTATILVQRGTLKVGSHLVAGQCSCKVRVMKDDAGRNVEEIKPSQAVKVAGWKELPSAGI
jgi:translation initiation factor IF-2